MEKKSKMIKQGFHKKENGKGKVKMLPPPSNIRKPLLAKLKTELLQSNKSTDEWKRWGG